MVVMLLESLITVFISLRMNQLKKVNFNKQARKYKIIRRYGYEKISVPGLKGYLT
jgi:hypothetical protein